MSAIIKKLGIKLLSPSEKKIIFLVSGVLVNPQSQKTDFCKPLRINELGPYSNLFYRSI
jgi:hypothetical protein